MEKLSVNLLTFDEHQQGFYKLMENIIVRSGTYDDLPAIHQLVRELAIYEKEEAAFTATLNDYQQDFEDGLFFTLVALNEDQIIGMMVYYMTYSTWKGKMLYLEDFVVNEDWRRHGVGELLFESYTNHAKALSCRILKWQVLDWNAPAVRFYEKKGAIIEKQWWTCKIMLR